MNEARIALAQQFAHLAHDSIGQKRKYSGEPYWVHTDEVAQLVLSVSDDEAMVCAAHLHDVLEDVYPQNPVWSPAAIEKTFGSDTLRHVLELTDVFTKGSYPKVNRAGRKESERLRMGLTSPGSQTIKLADLISNTKSIVANDPDFARTYLDEKMELLGHLVEGDPRLLAEATRLAVEGLKTLGLTLPTIVGKV